MEAARNLKVIEANLKNEEAQVIYDSNLNHLSLSLEYVEDLLANLSDINQCMNRNLTLKPCMCNIRNTILEPTVEMLEFKLNKAVSLSIDDETSTEDVFAFIDPLHMKQIVSNLILNAMKFTTFGFVKIGCTTYKDPFNENIFRVTVSDSGCGIEQSEKMNVFKKWEKFSHSTKFGIGLYLGRSLVEAMGGIMYVSDDYDSGIAGHPGSQFCVEIPTKTTSEPCSEKPKPCEVGHADGNGEQPETSKVIHHDRNHDDDRQTVQTLSRNGLLTENNGGGHIDSSLLSNSLQSKISCKLHLLCVDDDPIFRIMLRRRLKRIMPGAIIDEAPCGEEAILKAKDNVYDIITMDHFMSTGLNGSETIQALREHKVDATIVGLSGNTMERIHLTAGADDFLRKPIPDDHILLERLMKSMAPPANWNVMVADDNDLSLKFLHRKLLAAASPHFTTLDQAEKRWRFTLKSNGEDASVALKKEWFDLVVLDQNMGDGMKGTDVAKFVR